MEPKINPAEYVNLVWKIARGYQKRCSIPVDDLVGVGTLGLMSALESYDPTRGTKFATWAYWWIAAAIGRAVDDAKPVTRRGRLKPTSTSLDAPIGSYGDLTLHDVMPADAPSPEDELAAKEERAILWREIAKLPLRERKVLRMRFVEGLTLAQVGERFGCSREWIRQLEAKAFAKLLPQLERALA